MTDLQRLLVAGALAVLTLMLHPSAAMSQVAELRVTDVRADQEGQVDMTVVLPVDVPPLGSDGARIFVEEGGQAREVDVVAKDDRPLDLVILIDTSGSMRGPALSAAKDAATRFVGLLPPSVRAAVVGFGSSPTLASAFTDDRAATGAAIAGLTAAGETALYDAVIAASQQFADGDDAHRAVVLLSDGGDTVSGADLETAAVQLSSSGAVLYAIALQTGESDQTTLATLTSRTGGEVLPAADPATLPQLYERIAAALVNRYQVRFAASGTGRTPFSVTVETTVGVLAAELVVDLPGPGPAPSPDRPAPTTAPAADAGWRSSSVLLGASGLAVFVALSIMLGTLLTADRREPQLARLRARGTGSRDRRTAITELAVATTAVIDRSLRARGWRRTLNTALERAGIDLRPAEFVLLVGSASITLVSVSLTLGSTPLAILSGIVPIIVARLALSILARRRSEAFAGQLADILQLLSGSLRAGYGLMQAIDAVAREADPPASEEFRRLLVETRLGRDLHEALGAMADRIESEDFSWVVQAIEINREVGGDLAEVLDNVARTIRERDQIRRQIKALSAEGRLSAVILLLLPVVVGLLMAAKDPSYILELVRGGPLGLALIGTGITLMTIGTIWIRRVVRLVF